MYNKEDVVESNFNYILTSPEFPNNAKEGQQFFETYEFRVTAYLVASHFSFEISESKVSLFKARNSLHY